MIVRFMFFLTKGSTVTALQLQQILYNNLANDTTNTKKMLGGKYVISMQVTVDGK